MNTLSDENDDARNVEGDRPWKNLRDQVYDNEDKTWPLVLVAWLDAHTGEDGPGWTDTDEYVPGPCHPLTVGWIWPKCKEGYLTICGTVMNHADEPETVSDVNHIPWACVTAIYSLAVHLPINWDAEGFRD